MNALVKLRNRFRLFLSDHEMAAMRCWHGVLIFVSLLIINRNFGYLEMINKAWIAVLVAVLCAFIPLSGSAFIVCAILVLHLTKLSMEIALTTVILLVLCYLVCAFYRGKRNFYIILLPVFRQMNIPYVAPMESGLLGEVSEISTIICGGVMSFFLNDVKTNAAAIMDGAEEASAVALLTSLLQNRLFYVYMVALIAMFLVVYLVKYLKIDYAWFLAVLFGVLTEFAIMLAGYLFVGQGSRIPQLIVGSIVTLVFGVVLNFFFRDLDYSRVERVQFEDDDYYYYVTAVPKNRIAAEQKKVQKITGREPEEP